jgi:hypothetical protein
VLAVLEPVEGDSLKCDVDRELWVTEFVLDALERCDVVDTRHLRSSSVRGVTAAKLDVTSSSASGRDRRQRPGDYRNEREQDD